MNHSRLQNVTPFDFSGLQIRDPALESLTSGSVAHIEVAPGASHPKAKSTKSDKLYICIDGSLAFTVDGNRVDVEPIDLLVIQKNEWFEYENVGSKQATVLLIHIPPFDLESEVFHH